VDPKLLDGVKPMSRLPTRDRVIFTYARPVIERYPTIRAGVIHATEVTNGPSSRELLDQHEAEQRAALARLKDVAIADLAPIRAWRRAFAGFGAKPTQYRSAAEALLRRLTKQGEIPTINTLVDIGNLTSIRYAVPVAVFDLAGIARGITVRFAKGNEPFTDLGATESVTPDPGEVIFVDETDVVCARRWCWRQSTQSACGPTTRDVLIVVEGLHDTAARDITAALRDLDGVRNARPGTRTRPCCRSTSSTSR
jgi:DNA/RNA-binding domain of Phe-tRNA-synthetase-like protein